VQRVPARRDERHRLDDDNRALALHKVHGRELYPPVASRTFDVVFGVESFRIVRPQNSLNRQRANDR
jgi:hypothetical protein